MVRLQCRQDGRQTAIPGHETREMENRVGFQIDNQPADGGRIAEVELPPAYVACVVGRRRPADTMDLDTRSEEMAAQVRAEEAARPADELGLFARFVVERA